MSVSALHVGYMDTDMVTYIPADQKTDPAVVARLAVDGVLDGHRRSSPTTSRATPKRRCPTREAAKARHRHLAPEFGPTAASRIAEAPEVEASGLMEKISLTALARQELASARSAGSGRSAHTVYGGHEHALRQTLIALIEGGHGLDEHESPGGRPPCT